MRPFLQSRAGVAGLVLLGLFAVLAVAGPLLVPYPQADRYWHDISYWQDSPAAAPPVWAGGTPGRNLAAGAPQTALGDDGSQLVTWSFSLGGPVRGGILEIAGEGPVLVIVDGETRTLEPTPGQPARWTLDVPGPELSVTEYLPAGQEPLPAPRFRVPGTASGLLGTDSSKRDLFSGLVLGIRWALLLGVLVSFLTVVAGLLLGTLAACYGGFWDLLINRTYEFFSLMPVLPFLIVLSAAYHPSLWNFLVLSLVFFWTRSFKTVYARALQIKQEVHLDVARSMGAPKAWLIGRHVLPELLPYGFAVMALTVPGIILYESSVSLLGLGDTTTVTWGQVLHDALVQGAVSGRLWWWILPPGVAIAVTGLAFALVGRGLDRVVNPRAEI